MSDIDNEGGDKGKTLPRPRVEMLVEHNKKVLAKVGSGSAEMKALREAVKRRQGFDPFKDTERFPVLSESFNWGKAKAKIELREADSASTFNQVLRAGVQVIANNAYQNAESTFEQWVQVVPSTKDTELYAPLQGLSFPREIPRQGKYSESTAAGLDISLKNRKYGSMYAVEMELIDDDQTGQFNQQASLLGVYMKLVAEVLCYAKLASVANMKYQQLRVSKSETQPSYETTYPWRTAASPFRGGGYNRPATYGLLTGPTLADAIQQSANQKNLLGIEMVVDPTHLICSYANRFNIATILNSSWYPSVPSATPGATGWTNSDNQLKAIVKPVITRYLFDQTGKVNPQSTSWYLADAKVPGFILQMRETASVTQENPDSGQSFEQDIRRFKVKGRMNADFIDPRFFWQGNNGSVTS